MSRICLVSLLVGLASACTGSSSMTMSGDDTSTPDAPSMQSALDPADCTAFAQSFATAAQTCGTALPAGGQAAFEGWCKKGITAGAQTMCGGNPGAGLDCFASPDPQDWVCSAGEPYPACGGDLGAALGALCIIALGNPACSTGVHCNYDVDCSSGLTCNSATHQCMSKSAYCIGLPCNYDVDCPTGETCNSAEGACVGR